MLIMILCALARAFVFAFIFVCFEFGRKVSCTWAINEVFLPQQQIKLESNSGRGQWKTLDNKV